MRSPNEELEFSTDSRLLRQGLILEYTTLSWNVVGTAVVVWAAINSHSVALIGFGLDSLVEIGASTVVIWELTGTGDQRRKRALRMIGVAFIALATYVLISSVRAIYIRSHPGTSPLVIVWLVATFVAMLVLAVSKGRVGRKLNNPVLVTESRVTMVDAYFSRVGAGGLDLECHARMVVGGRCGRNGDRRVRSC